MLKFLIQNIDNILLRVFKHITPNINVIVSLKSDVALKLSCAISHLDLNEYKKKQLAEDIEEEMFNSFINAWKEKYCTIPNKAIFIKLLTNYRDKTSLQRILIKNFNLDEYYIKNLIIRILNAKNIKLRYDNWEMYEVMKKANKIFNNKLIEIYKEKNLQN